MRPTNRFATSTSWRRGRCLEAEGGLNAGRASLTQGKLSRLSAVRPTTETSYACSFGLSRGGRPERRFAITSPNGRSRLNSSSLSPRVPGSAAIPRRIAASSSVGYTNLRLLLIALNLSTVGLSQADDLNCIASSCERYAQTADLGTPGHRPAVPCQKSEQITAQRRARNTRCAAEKPKVWRASCGLNDASHLGANSASTVTVFPATHAIDG